jgi:hypothetical protein
VKITDVLSESERADRLFGKAPQPGNNDRADRLFGKAPQPGNNDRADRLFGKDAQGKSKTAPPVKIDPRKVFDEAGKLQVGAEIQYANQKWRYIGGVRNEWHSPRGDVLRRGDAAQAEIMKSLGHNSDGTPRPEFHSMWDEWKSWWGGKHGDIGAWSRQKKGNHLAKAAGVLGSLIDRATQPRDEIQENTKSGAVAGAGIIHLSEIPATIGWLEDIIGSPLAHNTLGSVGKKRWSGDLDIAVGLEHHEITEFIGKLSQVPDFKNVQRLPGDTVSMVVPIQDYNPNLENTDGRPRTGMVQVDFMVGDPSWLKLYYHSPGEDSSTKGVHRNILLAELAGLYKSEASEKKIKDGRPLWIQRHKFGPKGLFWIERTPKVGSRGDYLKANTDRVIEGPIRDANEIANRLGLSGPAALHSFETLWADIVSHHDPELVTAIISNLNSNSTFTDAGVPTELQNARD